MKKIICALLTVICALPTVSAAADRNPFFGALEHQIALNAGWGVNAGYIVPPPTQFVPYTTFQAQYSIPATFFGMPARQSLNAIMNVGYDDKYGWDWMDFTIPIVMLSGDFSPFYGERWYTGIGAGMGFQAQQNHRISSKLVFEFKVLFGYKITERWGAEIFVQHMSNGNTAPENNSYGFYGLGVNYSF